MTFWFKCWVIRYPVYKNSLKPKLIKKGRDAEDDAGRTLIKNIRSFPKIKKFPWSLVAAKLGSRAKRSKHDGKVLFPCSSHFCSCYYYVLGPSAFIWPFQSNLRWKTLKTRLRSALALLFMNEVLKG